MTTKEAINAIIDFNTLPPQIDYTLPWRIKADEAEKKLNQLTPGSTKRAYAKIRNTINRYYDSGAAEMDSLF